MVKNVIVILTMILISGCAATKLNISNAAFEPLQVKPGEKVMFKILVEDGEGLITQVKSTWQEDRNYQVELNDKGENGDKLAGDGIWSSTFNVPWNAPANVYYWDFTAHDASGNIIKTKGDGDDFKLLKETTSVEVVR